jgi:hypothetical protein
VKKPFQTEIERWKKLNKENHFSSYDYIFHVLKIKEVNPDILFAFLNLFWPEFVMHKDRVFLKEEFELEKFEELEKRKENVEYWINLVLISPYFENDDAEEEKAKSLSESIAKIWQTKLENDFFDRKFNVLCYSKPENGDFGLTFYQTKYEKPQPST